MHKKKRFVHVPTGRVSWINCWIELLPGRITEWCLRWAVIRVANSSAASQGKQMLLASSALTGESIEESSSLIVDHSTVGWQGTVTSCERGLVVVPTYYSTISQPKAHGFIAIFIFHRKSCGIWVLPGGGGGVVKLSVPLIVWLPMTQITYSSISPCVQLLQPWLPKSFEEPFHLGTISMVDRLPPTS